MSDDDARAPTLVVPGIDPVAGMDELRAGDAIGRYRLGDRLGAGAMGVVWAATDPQLERRVAIKVVHARLARSPDASGRLLREARAMAKLSHRAVVTVHDAGEVDGRLFVAMELVSGTTLGQLLRERTAAERADWRRWLAVMLDAGRGLAAAHQGGVLHRDFKPDNVLVDDTGRVCVGDFGLATLTEGQFVATASREWRADAVTSSDPELTTTGALLGTPAYMSPQQLRAEPIDARADQFAFCVATYEALYGTRPFVVTATGLEMLTALDAAIEARELVPVPADSPVPPAVRAILVRGLDVEPDARWPDIETLVGELQRAAGLDRRRAATVPAMRRMVWPLALAGVAAVALVVWLVARRGDTQSVPRRLFDVTIQSRIAISADGKRLALGGDRIEVRDLDGDRPPRTATIPADRGIDRLELDGETVRFGYSHAEVFTWRYAGDTAFTLDSTVPGRWLGRTAVGDLVGEAGALALVANGRELRRWPAPARIDVVAISPSGRRVAYIDSHRFDGAIVVLDPSGGVIATSERKPALTALAWRDDSHLVFATGTYAHPAIESVEVTAAGFGATEPVFARDVGWFSALAAAGDRIAFVDAHPSTRIRIITGSTVRDFDRTIAAPLGWASAGALYGWNRRSGSVEIRALDQRGVTATPLVLDGDPVDTTLSDTALIVALRRVDAREVIAMSLATGKTLWRAREHLLAVRCAGDRSAPCYAIVDAGAGESVIGIDAPTGTLGAAPIFTGRVEDIAVSTDAKHILISSAGGMRELELATGASVDVPTPLRPVRSVAYNADGSILSAGTRGHTYEVHRQVGAGAPEVLLQSADDILSLVRPSPDGARVLVLARSFAAELWLLDR